ncbi:TlpA disulfide reductase family protein [Dongia sp. agr-C8]
MTALAVSRTKVLVPVLIAILLAIGAGGYWYWQMSSAPLAPSGVAAGALPEGFKPMDPPMQMGGFAFQDADGNTVRLSDFKGRPVLLNIWAKWCAPCLAEMPKLNQLQAASAPGTLAVVAVAVDEPDPAKVRNFLANRRWDALKPYLDPKNVFAKALEIKAIPVSLLIDKNGYALVRVDAPVDWYSDEAIRLLKQTIL